jgi:hypothetical protein
MNLAGTQTVVGIARNAEAEAEDEDLQPEAGPVDAEAGDAAAGETPDAAAVGHDGSDEPDSAASDESLSEDDES